MKDLLKDIGRKACFKTEGLEISVKITNVRKAWGRIDYEITPVSGQGSKWVSSGRISIQDAI